MAAEVARGNFDLESSFRTFSLEHQKEKERLFPEVSPHLFEEVLGDELSAIWIGLSGLNAQAIRLLSFLTSIESSA